MLYEGIAFLKAYGKLECIDKYSINVSIPAGVAVFKINNYIILIFL